jgi:hypothetical protein
VYVAWRSRPAERPCNCYGGREGERERQRENVSESVTNALIRAGKPLAEDSLQASNSASSIDASHPAPALALAPAPAPAPASIDPPPGVTKFSKEAPRKIFF